MTLAANSSYLTFFFFLHPILIRGQSIFGSRLLVRRDHFSQVCWSMRRNKTNLFITLFNKMLSSTRFYHQLSWIKEQSLIFGWHTHKSCHQNDLKLSVIQNLYKVGEREATLMGLPEEQVDPFWSARGLSMNKNLFGLSWRGEWKWVHSVLRYGVRSAHHPNAAGGALQPGITCPHK